jgi:hypothetical protein
VSPAQTPSHVQSMKKAACRRSWSSPPSGSIQSNPSIVPSFFAAVTNM